LTTSQLNSNFNGLYLQNETDINNWVSALATRRGFLYRLKTTRTLVHKQLQIGPAFLLTVRQFC